MDPDGYPVGAPWANLGRGQGADFGGRWLCHSGPQCFTIETGRGFLGQRNGGLFLPGGSHGFQGHRFCFGFRARSGGPQFHRPKPTQPRGKSARTGFSFCDKARKPKPPIEVKGTRGQGTPPWRISAGRKPQTKKGGNNNGNPPFFSTTLEWVTPSGMDR